jgi:CRP-like cAMP-binding protein
MGQARAQSLEGVLAALDDLHSLRARARGWADNESTLLPVPRFVAEVTCALQALLDQPLPQCVDWSAAHSDALRARSRLEEHQQAIRQSDTAPHDAALNARDEARHEFMQAANALSALLVGTGSGQGSAAVIRRRQASVGSAVHILGRALTNLGPASPAKAAKAVRQRVVSSDAEDESDPDAGLVAAIKRGLNEISEWQSTYNSVELQTATDHAMQQCFCAAAARLECSGSSADARSNASALAVKHWRLAQRAIEAERVFWQDLNPLESFPQDELRRAATAVLRVLQDEAERYCVAQADSTELSEYCAAFLRLETTEEPHASISKLEILHKSERSHQRAARRISAAIDQHRADADDAASDGEDEAVQEARTAVTHAQVALAESEASLVRVAKETRSLILVLLEMAARHYPEIMHNEAIKAATQKTASQGIALSSLEKLDSVGLLDAVPVEKKQQLSKALKEVWYEPGSVLIQQGDCVNCGNPSTDCFFILERGSVSVTQVDDTTDVDTLLTTLQPGSHFGELALINDEPRTATISAIGHVRCLTLERSDFEAVFEDMSFTEWSQRETPALSTAAEHLMLSYNWDHQDAILRIVAALKQRGYSIWVDIEKMAGSTVEAMALAIENSALVIYGLAQGYQASDNCRMELSYACQRKKPRLPLMLQENFVATGWLGIILGTDLWYAFYGSTLDDEEAFQKQVTELEQAIGERGRG